MRCKKHATDLSSTVGVCASCLRERLISVISAQLQAEKAQLPRPPSRAATNISSATEPHSHPPPLIFPRSVSPYVAPRQSNNIDSNLRFYSTPQVGPTQKNGKKKKHVVRFSVLKRLFKSRSHEVDPEHRDPDSDPSLFYSHGTVSSSSSFYSSPSWFSAIFPSTSSSASRTRKMQSADFSGGVQQPRRQIIDRGMSPVGAPDSDDEIENRYPSGSGSSSELKKTPAQAPPPAVRRTKTGQVPSTGLAFCLSPLVRPSPSRHWNQKGGGGNLPQDIGFPGEIRVAGKPHLSTAASFCANRSRKLCDMGRVNHNR